MVAVVEEPATTRLVGRAAVAEVAEVIRPSFLLLQAARHIPMQLVRLVLVTHLRAREVVEGLAEAQLLQSAVQRLPQLGAAEEPVELTAQQASPEAPEALALTGTLTPLVAVDALRRALTSVGLVGLAHLGVAGKEGITALQGPQEASVAVVVVGAGQPPVMAAMAEQA